MNFRYSYCMKKLFLVVTIITLATTIVPRCARATPAPADLPTHPFAIPLTIFFWLIVAVAVLTFIIWIVHLINKRKQLPQAPKNTLTSTHWSHRWFKKLLITLGILVLTFFIVWLLAYNWSAQPLVTY